MHASWSFEPCRITGAGGRRVESCRLIACVCHCAGKHVYDVGMMGNGALAGLVAITSGTSTIYPWGALIVGFVAGAWYCLGSQVSIWMKVSSHDPPSIPVALPQGVPSSRGKGRRVDNMASACRAYRCMLRRLASSCDLRSFLFAWFTLAQSRAVPLSGEEAACMCMVLTGLSGCAVG